MRYLSVERATDSMMPSKSRPTLYIPAPLSPFSSLCRLYSLYSGARLNVQMPVASVCIDIMIKAESVIPTPIFLTFTNFEMLKVNYQNSMLDNLRCTHTQDFWLGNKLSVCILIISSCSRLLYMHTNVS